PTDAEHWQAVVRDEQLEGWSDGLLPQARCMALGQRAVHTRAALLGLTPSPTAAANPQWSYRAGPGGSSLHHELPCTTAAGEAKTLVLELSIGNDGSIGKAAFVE